MKKIVILLIVLESLIIVGEGVKKIGFGEQNYKREIGFEKQRKKEIEIQKAEELKTQQLSKENQDKNEYVQENTNVTDNQMFEDDTAFVSSFPNGVRKTKIVRNIEKPQIKMGNSKESRLINYIRTQNSRISENEIKRILRAVFGYSKQYNINPYLVLAVMNTESHFNHSTVSSAGARGLMQLMSFNFREFGVDNSVEGNIKGGVMHLKRDYNKTKDVVKTLVCYNAGCGRLSNNEWTRVKETREYIPKVVKYYNRIRNL